MSRANALWGAPRIHGELLKLGFEVAQSTVARRGVPVANGRFLAAFFHFAPDLAEAARAADQTGAALSGDKFSKFSLEVRAD